MSIEADDTLKESVKLSDIEQIKAYLRVIALLLCESHNQDLDKIMEGLK